MASMNPMDTDSPNHSQRRKLPKFVQALATDLQLDPTIRYDLSPIRISAKGRLDKLDDQEDTGIGVYSDRSDFRALAEMGDVSQRGWLSVSYSQLGGSSSRAFAWVGVVGRTIFVAAADSAVEANLEADADDIAGLGRNAYVELFIAAARAGSVSNILLPFLSRIWRNDLWAEMLMAAINRHLPGCTIWEGKTQIATYGSAKLVTSVRGHDGTAYVENLKEQTFEKGVRHLEAGGQWDRRESELPLGLGRARTTLADGTTTKSMTVVETPFRAAAVAALKTRAEGGSWKQVGEVLAEHHVPMPGARGGKGRTFADYSTKSARTSGAKSVIRKHLDYYRMGEWDEVRSVALPNAEIRGIELSHDPDTGRRYTTVRVEGMPWRPFLTDDEWTMLDEHEAQHRRSRKSGAASRRVSADELVSAFMGVPTWTENGRQLTLVPDSPTAYRLRSRPIAERGWNSGEGTIEATLRRTLFNVGCGRALLDGLRSIEDQLALPQRAVADDDPCAMLESLIVDLTAKIAAKENASRRADEELERAGADDVEADHWRAKGKAARKDLKALETTLADTNAQLAAAADQIVDAVESSHADIAEPVLLASLLIDGTKKVSPVVSSLLDEYGITGSLRLTRPNGSTGMVRATANARLPLLDGTTFDIPLQWDTPDSHGTTGDGALVPAMIRAWANGDDFAAIADQFPGHDAKRVKKRLAEALARGGLAVRGLRAAALKCPVPATRQVIAARILSDPTMANPQDEAFANRIIEAYFKPGVRQHVATWSDSTNVDGVRRVLASLTGNHPGSGINADLLARNTGVAQATVRKMGRDGLIEKVGPFALRAKDCPAAGCRGRLLAFTPAPETGSGLVCTRCWRAEGHDAVLGEQYIEPWVSGADGYAVTNPPAVAIAKPQRDRLLSVTEVADRLGISAFGVRQLDRDDELVPVERTGANSGRLYRVADVEGVPDHQAKQWRQRFGVANDDGLLGTGDVAAILGCSPSLVRDFANAGKLTVASTTAGGHRRFRRSDVAALDPGGISAYGLTEIGVAAATVGLRATTLRTLADDGLVPSTITSLGQRRFDMVALRSALDAVGLLGDPSNPLVSIGELAKHAEVKRTTSELRRLANDGTIPTAGRIGGKRRFRLQDVLDALDAPSAPDGLRDRLAGSCPTQP